MITSKTKKNERVLVAMSGGVDSSVCAALLQSQGYDVVGVHMQLWDQGASNFDRTGARCCSTVDANDARRVCDKIGAPFYVVNAHDVFRSEVVDYFVHEYLQSRTPNPCVQCNNKIKFNYLFQKADELDCHYVATGHYAQIGVEATTGIAHLSKAADDSKDQTYFLFGMTQPALQRTLMPLGGLAKKMVRKLAAQFDLKNADKADSQEICFIGREGYKGFIEKNADESLRPDGVIQTEDGTLVGRHQGLYRYTVGQRKGLQLNVKNPERYFVVGFDTRTQALIVGPEQSLFKTRLTATHVNWLNPVDTLRSIECKAKIRSQQQESPCRVVTFENDMVYVEFKEPQRAVTPGQAIVFYKDNEVLGGGFIQSGMSEDVLTEYTPHAKKKEAAV